MTALAPMLPYRVEKDVQREVWRLLGLAGCKRYWMSQMRKTGQTKGIADLYAVHPRRGAAWIETKHPDCAFARDPLAEARSRQSKEQREFEDAHRGAGVAYLLVWDPQQVANWIAGKPS